MFNFSSPRLQGDFGLAYAIYYFTLNEYHVSIPLSDNQHYDLVVEKDNVLSRVQVKSTKSVNKYGKYSIQLRRVRCNNTENIIHTFDKTSVDFIFAVTEKLDGYLIPSSAINATQSLTLSNEIDQYLVLRGPKES